MMNNQPKIIKVLRSLAIGTLGLALSLATLPVAAQEQNPQQNPQQDMQQAPAQSPSPDQAQQDQQGAPPAAPQAQAPSQYPDQAPAPQPNQPGQNDQENYPPVPSKLTLPAGTVISVHSSDWLSTDHNKAGDIFTATLAQPLVVDGWVVARRGQNVTGRVVSAEKAGRVKGVSKLGLELGELTLVDGQILPVKTQLLQGTGGTSNGRDAAAVVGTTGLGAAIGAAAGWGTGAAIGAGAGAAAGIIGVLVTRGRPTVVGPEELLTFRLHDPITFSTARGQLAYLLATPDDYARPQHERRYVRRYPYAYGPPPPPYYYPYYGPYWGYPGWRW